MVEQRKSLGQAVAAALGGLIVRRDEVKDASGRTLSDYILQRHWVDGAPPPRRYGRLDVSAEAVAAVAAVGDVAVVRARVEHERRGGAPLPPLASAPMKVGSRAARVRHDRLGGAPLPPLRKR